MKNSIHWYICFAAHCTIAPKILSNVIYKLYLISKYTIVSHATPLAMHISDITTYRHVETDRNAVSSRGTADHSWALWCTTALRHWVFLRRRRSTATAPRSTRAQSALKGVPALAWAECFDCQEKLLGSFLSSLMCLLALVGIQTSATKNL